MFKTCSSCRHLSFAMQFVVEYYMYQEICNKTVYTCSIEYDSVLDQYMAQ